MDELQKLTPVTEETKPAREVAILSTERALKNLDRTKAHFDRRIAERTAEDQRKSIETQQRAVQPASEIPEGTLTLDEANAVSDGDLSGFEVDKTGARPRVPLTPDAQEKITAKRRLTKEFSDSMQSIQSIRRTEQTAPHLDTMTRLLEDRRRLFDIF